MKRREIVNTMQLSSDNEYITLRTTLETEWTMTLEEFFKQNIKIGDVVILEVKEDE